MPIGTPFHARTLALCESLSFRDWAGYYAASSYEPHHEHEYNAIRNAVAVIDISPLFKYRVSGPDATRLIDRVVTRDMSRVAVGQVIYTPWCDEDGSVLDDGTVARLDEQVYRWTAAEPNLRWFTRNALGLDVSIEDLSEQVAALALQGPQAAGLLRRIFAADPGQVDLEGLRYFRLTRGRIAGVPVDLSRTGYTGDLGYELWMPAAAALPVWDALFAVGRDFDLHPAGMLALDVARVEAGLLLLDVDFMSSRKAMIPQQRTSPFELGLGRLVHLDKARFVGQRALRAEQARGPRRRVVGLEVDWPSVEALHERLGLPPVVPAAASRVAVPVYAAGEQVGKATSTTWSPALKKLIALATVDQAHAEGELELEVTLEAVRHRVLARVTRTPFFDPERKTRTPPG